jgi:HEAT repeat protein
MKSFCANCFAIIEYGAPVCPCCHAPQNRAPGNLRDKLIRALKHPLGEVRKRVSLVLGEKRVTEATNALAEVIERDPDPYVTGEAVVALSKMLSPAALAAIERAALHESFLVRKLAVRALIAAGGEWRRKANQIARGGRNLAVRTTAKDGRRDGSSSRRS